MFLGMQVFEIFHYRLYVETSAGLNDHGPFFSLPRLMSCSIQEVLSEFLKVNDFVTDNLGSNVPLHSTLSDLFSFITLTIFFSLGTVNIYR